MRAMSVALVLSTFIGGNAMAQTAEFKCAKPGIVVEFSNGTRTTWQGAEGNYCKLLSKPPTGDEFASIWYAPTLSLRADQSRAFADQIKPWTLWPLSVGKKITGRYDGVGSNPGFGAGSWINTITVDSYEKLTTKAGTFDVFVVSKSEEAISHKYRSTFRQWYAPALGATVKFTFADNQGANRAGEATAIRQ